MQDELFRHIPGLEKAEIMRYGYAVEYDFAPPQQLKPSLETKLVAGLYFAGQLNGTTGYEEAAAQGLIAGANAALAVQDKEPLVLGREQAYIGVLIDDLVTCGVDEPYRMFTSRAEYRLLLRHDNADRRLTPIAQEFGLIDSPRWERLQQKLAAIQSTTELLQQTRADDTTLARLLLRANVGWDDLLSHCPQLAEVSDEVANSVMHDLKYAGYVDRQRVDIERQQRLASKRIPDSFDYAGLPQLRIEAREKLYRVRPQSLAQASRVSGITPADVALLRVYLEGKR